MSSKMLSLGQDGYVNYVDEGCYVSPLCTDCPAPECRHDNTGLFQAWWRRKEDQEKWDIIQEEKLTAQEAANRFGVDIRTIFHIRRRIGDGRKTKSMGKKGRSKARKETQGG